MMLYHTDISAPQVNKDFRRGIGLPYSKDKNRAFSERLNPLRANHRNYRSMYSTRNSESVPAQRADHYILGALFKKVFGDSKAQLEAKSEKSYLADPGGCPMTMQVCPHLGSPHLPLILPARRMFAGSKC